MQVPLCQIASSAKPTVAVIQERMTKEIGALSLVFLYYDLLRFMRFRRMPKVPSMSSNDLVSLLDKGGAVFVFPDNQDLKVLNWLMRRNFSLLRLRDYREDLDECLKKL